MDIIVEKKGETERYTLILIDRATRFVKAIPIKDRKASTVAIEILDKRIHLWGCPIIIYSDNERAFCGELMGVLAE